MQKERCFAKSTRAKDAERDHGEYHEPKIRTFLWEPHRAPANSAGH